MSGASYYWQGGRKIEIQQAGDLATMEIDTVEEAEEAAREAGVPIRGARRVAPGLVRFECPGDRDGTMSALRHAQVVHHVYAPKNDPEGQILVTDSFFIKFKKDTPEEEVLAYFRQESLEVVEQFGPRSYLVRVTEATGRNPVRTANSACLRPDVEYAEPNLMRELVRFDTIPTDPRFPFQWHLHAPSGGFELAEGADVNAPAAWDTTIGKREVVVAVADDGFDVTHPDFQGTGKIAGTLNVSLVGGGSIAIDSDVLPRPGDYHGTPCAGVAVAEINGQGTVGVAPGCALLAVRFPISSISDSQLAKMFEELSPQADVVSCSWGYGPADVPMSTTLRDTITELAATGGRRGKGFVICIAAGNNNCPVKDLNNTDAYEWFDSGGNLRIHTGPIDRWLAAHPDVLTVSAMTSEKKRSAYSSWGDDIDVCAPSDNWDDLRRVDPPGRGIRTTDNEGFGQGSDFTPGSRYTSRFGGTSSATPTVAGVCALVISKNPSLSGEKVRNLIRETARKDLVFQSATPVNSTGDFVNGHSQWFGRGLVDAAAAVAGAGPKHDEVTLVDETAQDVPIKIPDAGTAIVSEIEVEASGRIDEIRVAVEIDHTFIGDLRVDLIAPDGSVVNLHNHEGWSTDDIDRTYTPVDRPALGNLIGESVAGTWKLRVIDTWFWFRGSLVSWRLGAKISSPVVPASRPTAKAGLSKGRAKKRVTAKR